MPFGMGMGELILVMLVLLLVFGAKRLPELGSGLGKGIREFKKSMNEINREIERPSDENREIRPPQRQPPAVTPPPSEVTQDSEKPYNK
jgi:sec-independent protein translocase protein TatA